MTMDEKEATSPEDDDEDWMKYASATFGETDYSLWDDMEESTPSADDDLDQGSLEMPDQLGTHMEEIPRAPAAAGLKHMVRIGLCNMCLGRLGGKKRFEQSLVDSGEEIRQSVLEQDSHLISAREETPLCPLCENLFDEVALLSEVLQDALQPYEYKRLQLGIRFPKDQVDHEEEMRKRFGAAGSDSLKGSLVSVLSREVAKSLPKISFVNEKPDILALIDVLTLTVELDVRAVYIYGRYRKLERGIPQTRWPCRVCKGRGCTPCEQTGLQYKRSVQDLIGNPLIDVFEATEHAFHGMGREDIDVRCMGSGRPFVIELKQPRRRAFADEAVMEAINAYAQGSVEVTSIRPSNRAEVVRIKDTPAEKSYTIRFTLGEMNEAEYALLTAPLDLTKEDVQDRSTSKRKPRHQRGSQHDDHTKPLEAPLQGMASEYDEENLMAMKKNELEVILLELGLPKTGKKNELVERILSAKPPAPPALPLPDDQTIIDAIAHLNGSKLAQRTPERVAHRRADLVRRRTVYEAKPPIIEVNEDGIREIEFTLRCESGTYVKETVHGDAGRTQPSLAALIKAKCNVMWLDVGDIHAD